jgi:low temperature requirement protein LtrA
VPGLGRSTTGDWDIEGAHLAERCGLFIMIALGESLIVTGTAYAGMPASPPTMVALGVAFLGSVASWWLYFDTGADRGSTRMAESDDPGRLARLAYTYLHLPIVAGIVVAAVGDALTLTHPSAPAGAAMVATVLGGPALYVAGLILFKMAIQGARRPPLSHLVCLALMAALAWFAPGRMLLTLAGDVAAILILTALWETASLRRRTQR